MKHCLFSFICLLLSFACTTDNGAKLERIKIKFPEIDWIISVEVAKTNKQREKGLMDREKLSSDQGMLFVFEQEINQQVWMKNTLIPLDILFISTKGKVVSIIKNLEPCVQMICEIYSSGVKAKFMLEINAGQVNKNNIEIGQEILFINNI